MKQSILLNRNWQVKMLEPMDILNNPKQYEVSCEGWMDCEMPEQIYTILVRNKILDDLERVGDTRSYLPYCDKDWLYRCVFTLPKSILQHRARLIFCGLDTLADVYLNGQKIASSRSMYIPLEVEVTEYLAEENFLLIHFHSPTVYIHNYRMKEEWNDFVPPHHVIRKNNGSFTSYYGAKPYICPIGPYDDIKLEILDSAEISYADIRTDLSPDLKNAHVRIKVTLSGKFYGKVLRAVLLDADGILKKVVQTWTRSEECDLTMDLLSPILWWPRGYGNPYLYRLQLFLEDTNGKVIDKIEKNIGFRRITTDSSLHFKVNNISVRLWGANFAPLHAHTSIFDSEKMKLMMDYAEQANMVSLRIWGGGIPYKEELYDEADRRGILLWQDFFHDWGMYPDDEEFRALCRAEVFYMVSKLKHHPSILLWCGGNENYQSAEMENTGKFISWEIFEMDYKEIVASLDPQRYYHPNSPYGGQYANDPLKGDSHVYSHIWFNRGYYYPVFQTEDCRVCVPHIRSMKRMLNEEELWPSGYTGQIKKPGDTPFPLTWHKRALVPDYISRIPPIENFYDADNVEDFIYRFSAAHAWFMRDCIERVRRGRPASDIWGERRCSGHYVWRLFDTWPQIFCSLIDYYNEPFISYYAVARAYSPFLLCFEKTDHIFLWAVNDTPERVMGILCFKLYNPKENRILKEVEIPASIEAGQSMPLLNLDDIGEFKRENFLYAEFRNNKGKIIVRCNDYVDIERHLYFPECKLSLFIEGDMLTIRTDSFARCVELSGNEDGDEFGWFFEDNYFDLFFWEEKKVKIKGRHKKGKVTAKSRFSPHTAEIEFCILS